MKSYLFLAGMLVTSLTFAETKMSFDVTIDKLNFVKPLRGVGKAGSLVFKSASVFNNGIVLNVNNVNNYFDSQIFVRPTFLGFTTQFGNFGFGLEENSLISTVQQADLLNSKFIMDENQLSLSGESMNFINADSSIKLKAFRIYCQNNNLTKEVGVGQTEVMNSCFKFMTLNGSYGIGNELAQLEYEGVDGEDKTFIKGSVNSVDIRETEILANLPVVTTVSNDSYIINATNVVLSCAKDPDLMGMDLDKIKNACFNQLRLNPAKASIIDKIEKSKFNLDVQNIVVKDKILYVTLNSGVLSDSESSTYITKALINCRKNIDSDLMEITHVLRDCLQYGRVSLGEVKSDNNAVDKKDSSNKNIAISVENGSIIIQADVKFLGLTSRVSIYGTVSLNEEKKQIIMKVTDTRLPLGITSVKLLMHFLKKDLISKDISIYNNVITISI